MSKTPFDHLVRQFSKLPGLGPRSAKRIAIHMLTSGKDRMTDLAQALSDTAEQMKVCECCGNLDTLPICNICADQKRDQKTLCIVAGIADIWAIERTSSYRGLYHVLGGILSAIDGVTPDHLSLSELEQRLKDEQIEEIILALSATVDGQTTAHYVTDIIHRHHNQIKISRLAHGMPVGGELDYLDDGTIMTAFKSRRSV